MNDHAEVGNAAHAAYERTRTDPVDAVFTTESEFLSHAPFFSRHHLRMAAWLEADLPFPFSLYVTHIVVSWAEAAAARGDRLTPEVTGRKARRISKKDTKRSTEKAGADEIWQILGGLNGAVSIWFENASLNMK